MDGLIGGGEGAFFIRRAKLSNEDNREVISRLFSVVQSDHAFCGRFGGWQAVENHSRSSIKTAGLLL